MQMCFLVYVWQAIEHQLQVSCCIMTISGYYQAKAIITMPITILLSCINKLAKMAGHVMPVFRNKYGYE